FSPPLGGHGKHSFFPCLSSPPPPPDRRTTIRRNPFPPCTDAATSLQGGALFSLFFRSFRTAGSLSQRARPPATRPAPMECAGTELLTVDAAPVRWRRAPPSVLSRNRPPRLAGGAPRHELREHR